MGHYMDLHFCAKLTDFGYEIIQEIYKNRPQFPVLLGKIEDYDDDGNRLYSNLEKICFKYEREDFIEEYDKLKLSSCVMFGLPCDPKENTNSTLTNNKEWIFDTYFKCQSCDDILELLTWVILEPVEIKSSSDHDYEDYYGYPLTKRKPLIINPTNIFKISKYKEVDIINGNIVAKRL